MQPLMQFLVTPIFHLTPYIFLWSILNGLIVIYLINLAKLKISQQTQKATGLTTALASILWNWSIDFNHATLYLNVDHPIVRASWADVLNGIGVYALTAFVLAGFINKDEPAYSVHRIASIAAIVTLFTDTFFF